MLDKTQVHLVRSLCIQHNLHMSSNQLLVHLQSWKKQLLAFSWSVQMSTHMQKLSFHWTNFNEILYHGILLHPV